MKKLLSFLFMAFIPIAMRAYDCEVDGIYYNLVEKAKVAKVTNSGSQYLKYTGDIVIPATITYNNVVYSVREIEEAAFYNCSDMTTIDIPESVTIIGGYAFSNCYGLTSINIPENVTSIENGTFSHCYRLTSIDIPNNVTSIGEDAFLGCSGLTAINIPDGITSIEKRTFNSCTKLTSIAIPNSVTSIGWAAFNNCASLTSINIPDGVTSIGDYAFGASSLTSINIPESVTSIGIGAFNRCGSLTSITVASGNTVYNSRNNCNAIIETSSNILIAGCKNTIIPDGVTSIGDAAFLGCGGLTAINIPDGVTSIGESAFYACHGLTSITIPGGVTRIGNSAFKSCSGLTVISILDGVTSIGDAAFANCSALTTIEIPNSVTSIGSSAFNNCENFSVVTCNALSVPSTNTSAFDGSDVRYATLIVPDASLSDYQSTAPWSNFGTILASSQATVVTANSYTREYGDANPNPFEYTSAVTLNGTPFITCAADATSAPGTYPIVISQGTVTNTGLVFVDGTLTITKAPLTITANSYTIKEGDAMPAFDAVFTGLKNNEAESVVSPVVSCTTTDSNTPGTYDINVTATSDNYAITTVAGTLTILPDKMSITIGAPGVGTYCSPYDLDFSTVTDFKAYIATGYNSATGNVIVQAVKDVPAGTGLFLKGTPGTYDVPCGESSSYYVNMLVGVTEATTISATDGNMTNFLLSATNTSDACFRPISSTYNLKANRAYLQIPTSMVSSSAGANAVGIEFEEGVTGIDNSLSDMDTDAHWFTLDGRKLNGKPTQKGIYVVNGQKVVIK